MDQSKTTKETDTHRQSKISKDLLYLGVVESERAARQEEKGKRKAEMDMWRLQRECAAAAGDKCRCA